MQGLPHPRFWKGGAAMSDFYNIEAEKIILARILTKGFAGLPESQPASGLSFSNANGIIYDAARTLRERGEAVNTLAVAGELRASGNLDRAGGLPYISELSIITHDIAGLVESACESVAAKFKQRELHRTVADALGQIDAGNHEEALASLSRALPCFAAGDVSNAVLGKSLVNDVELAGLEIPKRESLMGDWFKAGDYGIIFGPRGLGKSWLGMGIARSLAEGRAFGPWACYTSRRVLYVDGEMSLDDYRERIHTLSEVSGAFFTLSHQAVFDRTQKALCLSDRAQQDELTRLCERERVDVLILDNGACLFRGVAENDADAFRDMIEGWLLDLRRRGVAVVLVQHAGRNGAIRGTSKREDAAFWILRLDDAGEPDGGHGARFITRFVKNRNASQDPPPLDWHFTPDRNRTLITYREADSMALFRQWIEDGLTSCDDIAREMGVTKGTVSKWATKAIGAGWLRKDGRGYALA